MDERDDAGLVRRALEGDGRAFDTLVRRYTTPIFNLAFRLVNDRDVAADITQAAFVRVYENLHQYDPKYRFFSWLYRIAINESYTTLQRRRGQDPLHDEIESHDETPHTQLLRRERDDHVQQALMRLNENERAVIVLRHYSDMSYEEIADTLGVKVKTVKSRLFSARMRLRLLLAPVTR